jgi:hypothetical protein
LIGQILSVLACYSVAKHSARGNNGEENDSADGDGELNNTDDQGRVAILVKEGDVDGRCTSDGEDDQQED